MVGKNFLGIFNLLVNNTLNLLLTFVCFFWLKGISLCVCMWNFSSINVFAESEEIFLSLYPVNSYLQSLDLLGINILNSELPKDRVHTEEAAVKCRC